MKRHHGGIQHGMRENVLDFSTTYNLYGTPKAVVDAIGAADITSYPDPLATKARLALSTNTGFPINHFAIGHGATDLFWALAKTLMVSQSHVVIVEPCFSEFSLAIQSSGGVLHSYRLSPPSFDLRWEEVETIILKTQSTILAIETPHNPSGFYTPVEEIVLWTQKHPEITVVCDLSFLALSRYAQDFPLSLPDNLVIVCSLTKTFAISGLRAGYIIAHPNLIKEIEKHRPSWHTNVLVQEAIVAMMTVQEDVQKQCGLLLCKMEGFLKNLKKHHMRPLPSCTLFVLVHQDDGELFVKTFLEKHQILLRSCASFGLDDYMRLSLRSPEMLSSLFQALDAEGKA